MILDKVQHIVCIKNEKYTVFMSSKYITNNLLQNVVNYAGNLFYERNLILDNGQHIFALNMKNT